MNEEQRLEEIILEKSAMNSDIFYECIKPVNLKNKRRINEFFNLTDGIRKFKVCYWDYSQIYNYFRENYNKQDKITGLHLTVMFLDAEHWEFSDDNLKPLKCESDFDHGTIECIWEKLNKRSLKEYKEGIEFISKNKLTFEKFEKRWRNANFTKIFNYLFPSFSQDFSKVWATVKMDKEFMITTRAIDFVRMSNGVSWSSCLDLNKNNFGSYVSGVSCSATSTSEFLILSEQPESGKLYARILCSLNEEQNIIGMTKWYPYGDFNYARELTKKVFKEINLMLNDKFEKGKCNTNTDDNYAGYFDYYSIKFINKNKFNNDDILIFGEKCKNICIICGEEIWDEEGLCKQCRKNYLCCCCDSFIENPESHERNGVYYCDSCYEDLPKLKDCEICGEEFEEYKLQATNDGTLYCSNCEDEVTECDHCGIKFVTHVRSDLCDDCYEELKDNDD